MNDVDWGTVFEWSTLLKCFVVGGLICVIGQILIDKTKLTPARILVTFVTLRCYSRRTRYLSVSCRLCRSRCNRSFNWFWI